MTTITQFTGSSGNTLVDAMFATAESLTVPWQERATIAGTTLANWGGPLGEGVSLTYSFADTGSTFSADYAPASNDIRDMSEEAKEAFKSGLAQWSTITNVQFEEVPETASSWGELRFFVSGSNPNLQPADTQGAEGATPTMHGAFGGFGPDLFGDVLLTPAAD